MKKIIELEDASGDQDHIHIYVDCNTNIPDRTAAILGKGEDPVPQMVRSAMKLQNMGADFLVMPCNTAHYFYRRLIPYIDIPVLHMIGETVRVIKQSGIHTVGILATDGTIQSGVYSEALQQEGIRVMLPSAGGQEEVMSLIYDGVKASKKEYPTAGIWQEMYQMQNRFGVQAFILGCTELPIAFQQYHITGFETVDPTGILARAAIEWAGEKTIITEEAAV